MSGLPSDLERIAPALAVLQDMQAATGYEDLELLVPEDVLMGVARAYGVPVRHIPELDCIYVAKRAEIRDEPCL